jgi:hypothetical protein
MLLYCIEKRNSDTKRKRYEARIKTKQRALKCNEIQILRAVARAVARAAARVAARPVAVGPAAARARNGHKSKVTVFSTNKFFTYRTCEQKK